MLIVHTQKHGRRSALLTSVHATCARVASWRRPVEVGRHGAVDVRRSLSGLVLRAARVAELGAETWEEASLLWWFRLPQSEERMAECNSLVPANKAGLTNTDMLSSHFDFVASGDIIKYHMQRQYARVTPKRSCKFTLLC